MCLMTRDCQEINNARPYSERKEEETQKEASEKELMVSTNADFDNEQMMRQSPGYWASQCPIKLQAGVFTFHGREYQVEPMNTPARRKCYLKATQFFGATELETLDDMHGMIMGKYLLGVAHIFPT
ncbi:hypothetical protein LCGC14_2731070, partial [marine sediment metagenome]